MRGIGRAIAIRLFHSGATVYALSKTLEHLKSLHQDFPEIHIVCVDLTDWEATERAVRDIGHVDLLVNNAGVAVLEPFLDIKPESFDKYVTWYPTSSLFVTFWQCYPRVFNVNLKAVINVSQVIAKQMVAKNTGGSIVNISSQVFYYNTISLPIKKISDNLLE